MLHFARKSESHRVEHAALHFREQANDMVYERGWLLTAAVPTSQFAVFVLVVFFRAAGIPASKVSFLAVLLSFAIARLVLGHTAPDPVRLPCSQRERQALAPVAGTSPYTTITARMIQSSDQTG